ncbi:HlyD family efflux transporter periplasmic adaptor subunit [Chamaesiphon sp. VAR_69_metabat_338]|uniref:HlyD family efflux transporter periplasmic adaptor subunit n=1 Tax=Chamaesiphon sp. VAR_69_metabat_338 TaxID=2964704 RepID=UPI00286E49FA|nr:HlyD family efflux transporter periplasmic adaptor subunit [Chamaesiphon sp. VAR_69_metabat_338]
MPRDSDTQRVNNGSIDIPSRSEIGRSHQSSQSTIFQQSQIWSRAIGWGIMGLIVVVTAWASFARIDEAIPAEGKLEPIDDAKKIQAPMAGVVKQIYVKNGDRVKAGDLLLRLESTVSKSQLAYLTKTKASLVAENRFYREQMGVGAGKGERASVKVKIAPEILALTKSRNALVAENQLYRAQLNGRQISSLTSDRQKRLQSNVTELNTRLSGSKLEIAQVREQIAENRVRRQGLLVQIAGVKLNIASMHREMVSGKESLDISLVQIDRQISQNQARLNATEKTLNIYQQMYADMQPAGAAGAISTSQVKRQEQEVVAQTSELEQKIQERDRLKLEKDRLIATSRTDAQKQQQRIQEQQQTLQQRQSEIAQLDREYARLQLSADRGIAKFDNDVAVSQKDLFSRLAENDKQIAQIDGQLNKSIVENDKKILETANQITQAQQNLKYQEIHAPVAGEVFELKAYPEGVVSSNSPDPIVQIIPTKDIIAKVYITNKDIGFVKIGQQVDVRIDTFNFSEFGDVKGTIEWIGSDALPPERDYPFARFPARIKLSKQALIIKGSAIQLKPGMSVKVNIKLRDRPVMSILTDLFFKQSDGLKNLR